MAETKGANRNYPSVSLADTLEIPRAIQNGASGMPVNRLTLAELVNRSPAASQFRERIGSSRAYGLTVGGINADQFELTELGAAATGGDEVARDDALRRAVMNIEPFRVFLTTYNGKKLPAATPFKDFLVTSASVPAARASECAERIVEDAEFVGLIRDLKGSKYVDISASPATGSGTDNDDDSDDGPDAAEIEREEVPVTPTPPQDRSVERAPKKVFIAHGKNRVPLDQLKKILDQFKVKYAVAVDEPHQGRPISAKVANLMRDECSSGIFIFTADEKFFTESEAGDMAEIWRPSENVVYELGAASMLYDRRIVVFKEKAVTFPSDFSDLGYIEFEQDQLVSQIGELFAELVSLNILEVRAKS